MQNKQKAKIVCPSEIAYGKKGGGNIIPPDTLTLFELEIVDLNQDGSPFKSGKQKVERKDQQEEERWERARRRESER